MPAERGPRAATATQGSGLGNVLHEDTVVEVLRAAQPAGALACLASTSRQLCSIARSRVPFHLNVTNPAQAQRALLSHARGRPPFSGCTSLRLVAHEPVECLLAASVVSTAQHWSALEELVLQATPGQPVDVCVSALLTPMLALKQLRRLLLTVPDLGPCSAGHIGHLVQLTCLELTLREPAAAAAAGGAEAHNRLELGCWSHLTNLRHLNLQNVSAPQPAASALGPFSLPSGLTAMLLRSEHVVCPATLACWLTHLPGCPQLQLLEVQYGCGAQHASAHPCAVVRLLAQHNPRLRQLTIEYWDDDPDWVARVPGLPDAAADLQHQLEWRPDAALAALRGLEELDAGNQLIVAAAADWRHLAQLTALTKLSWCVVSCAPPLQGVTCLSLLELEHCQVHLSGYALGRLLLACPQLQTAVLYIMGPAPVGPPEAQLQPHPRLQALRLHNCGAWFSPAAEAEAAAPLPPAAVAAPAAAAPAIATAGAAATSSHWDALAPVLKGVSALSLAGWPAGSSNSHTRGTLPDLSPCTALTKLVFGSSTKCVAAAELQLVPLEQEGYLSLVAPLVRLQRLQLMDAPRVNARVALALQGLLPALRRVELLCCGKQLRLTPALFGSHHAQQQKEQQALGAVRQLLRAGLVLQVI